MSECTHIFTKGREGAKGSWCCACGEKVYEVDERECGCCANHDRLGSGSICHKYLMAITPDMHVTYKIESGSCYEAKENVHG